MRVISTMTTIVTGPSADPVHNAPGTVVELEDGEARSLIERGIVREAAAGDGAIVRAVDPVGGEEGVAASTGKGDDGGKQTDVADPLVLAIMQLDPENPDHYTKDGVPKVEVLQALAGRDVSAAERDAAFAKYREIAAE